MIAKYNNQYFKISFVREPLRIWRYDYVKSFRLKAKNDGLKVYEKFVTLAELDEIFDVGFSVNWDGEWCGVFYSENVDVVTLHTNNRAFAEAHDMEEFERGTFDCARPASMFKEYRM